MPNLLDRLYWYETDQASSRPPPAEQLVDLEDGDSVLDFTYRFLEAHSRPASDDEVHNVTATIARCKEHRVVRSEILESFLVGLLTVERA